MLAQLLCGKGGVALLALAAMAPAREKPVGGAVELWLGCTSLGMPLCDEASWWPKTALNWGSCCLACVEVRRSCGEDEGERDGEGAGGEVMPVRPPWGIAESAAIGWRVKE